MNDPLEELSLDIDSLAFGGQGLARYPQGHPKAGKVVFVREGLPGERVRARLMEERKDFDRARQIEVLRASPDRVRPECPAFGRCGGCQLQHLAYPAQAAAKEGWLHQELARAGISPGRVQSIQASPGRLRYRFRARLSIGPSGKIGFRPARGRGVVAIRSCPVLTRPLDELLGRLSRLLIRRPPGRPLEVELAADGRGQGHALFLTRDRLPRSLAGSLAGLEAELGAAVLLAPPRLADRPAEPPPGSLSLPVAGLELSLFPGVFAQAQGPMNQALVRTVLDLALAQPGQRVLDLMAGMGNLSLPLAGRGASVEAVDISRPACLNGRYNAARLGLPVEFHPRPAAAWLRDRPAGADFDLVAVDPPREGIKELVRPLLDLAPPRLIYVSCDPLTLCRDLRLLAAGGYRVERIAPLDLMPQTFHLESVSLLTRS